MPAPTGGASPLHQLTARLRHSAELERLLAAVDSRRVMRLERLPIRAAAWSLELAAAATGRKLMVVLPRETDALAWLESTRLFSAAIADTAGGPQPHAVYVPAAALSPFQETEPSLSVRVQDALALDTMATIARPSIVATPRSFFRRLPSLSDVAAASLTLSVGDEVAPEALAIHLARHGYRRTELVSEVGAFALRGGVFDLFSPGMDHPVRLDLFGDEIETLRTFDPVSQRSLNELDRVRVLPLGLFATEEATFEQLATALAERSEPASDAGSEANERIESLATGEPFPGWENYLPLIAPEASGLAELFADALWVVSDPDLLRDEAVHHSETVWNDHAQRQRDGRLSVSPDDIEAPLDDVLAALARAQVQIGVAGQRTGAGSGSDTGETLDFAALPTDRLVGQLPRFPREVETARERGDRVLLVSSSTHHQRLGELLEGRGLAVGSDGVEMIDGEIGRGFRLPAAGATLFAEAQLFARSPRPQPRSVRRTFLGGLKDLRPGEFVVHEDHGIGQFLGMRTLSTQPATGDLPPSLIDLRTEERPSEVMEIVYAGERTLLLPIERLGQIQRYSGIEGVAPKLDRLGGSSWSRKKSRVKRGLQKLATDLLALYAKRKLARAPAANADSDAQSQFEAAFPHDETPDQLTAAAAVKADLEANVPMDRLLVGDVGFGKTEVAMRAAFKMIDNGYQVAVLAPTTILADQHLDTFRERFSGFPVEIEMISRFRTPAQVREIKKRSEAGELDLLIGTHRLLGSDVVLPRLALLIIDEEQRFGVGQKERFKEIRKNVHVLALSATPVPRTLQLSLAGVRDLSTIESPPKDRLAIETKIVPFSEELVREAIEFELERGGQVYYVYNRVEDIERVAGWLRELVPKIRITVGHGQLDESELSKRMHAFMAGEVDVLLATTIIENGIDIPNVNTMFVHRADRFGLAQLYQLRGRVGRSDQLAFCYLLLPRDRVLSEDARKRLTALRDFTELGAGFRIAARDLEIRGAGNLLGAEQSGHMAELGIETYLKMLEDTVRELRGEKLEDTPSTHLDLKVSVSIPEEYVSEPSLRMEIYQRLAEEPDSIELLAELRDRFGPPPKQVETLAAVAALKHLAERLRVQSIVLKGSKLELRFRKDARIEVDRLIELVAARAETTFSPDGVLTLSGVSEGEIVTVAQQTLEQIANPSVLGDDPANRLDLDAGPFGAN